MELIRNLIRFSRPHTVIGTSLSIVVLYLLAMSFSDNRELHLGILALTLVSCLGANIYIVGLNQITDIKIDRINKPWLPLASGAFSLRTGYWLVSISILISLIIAGFLGRYLFLTVVLSLCIGTAYSLPPLRLKRFYFWAAFCIIAVRSLIVNLLLFLHFHFLMNDSQHIPSIIWLLTGAMFVYSIVIAWFKDIPDMEGDSRFQIRTLSLHWGARSVFRIGNLLLTAVSVCLILLPFTVDFSLNRRVFAVEQLLILAFLWIAIFRVQLENPDSIRRYYLFVWVLFFLEYISFAIATLSA
ncbi:MAG: homogentisate phytyltransferase [Saprospiraceae bacterium]|nr:homogentisate phytyltransferase [Saprospiraceae bacterium]